MSDFDRNRFDDFEKVVTDSPLIGKGSFGSAHLKDNVVFKVVKLDIYYDEHLREICLSNSLKKWQSSFEKGSAYFVRIFGVMIGPQSFIISMEKADCSLFDYIISPTYAKRGSDISPLFELRHGLSFLHKKGWWHRDVKPGNILRFESGPSLVRWKFCDLGQARPHGSVIGINDSTPQCQTTYLYATPALLHQAKRPSIGCDADFYALGASILHAIFPQRFYLEEETERRGLHFALHVIPNLLEQARSHLLPDQIDLIWNWMSSDE